MRRSAKNDVFNVVLGEGDAGEAIADVLLVFGVNIEGFADVREDCLSGMRQLEGLVLGFAQQGPIEAFASAGIP